MGPVEATFREGPEAAWLENLEGRAFRALNRVAEPPIRRGFGSPCLAPWGLVVLEHTGRQSGRRHASPLWALRVGRRVIVTTWRRERSHWVRNLERQPRARLWMNGSRREVRAQVLDADLHGARDALPEPAAAPLRIALGALLSAGFAVSVLESV